MSFSDYGIHIDAKGGNNQRMICPVCSKTRNKSTEPCLSVDVKNGFWFCHHCGWKGNINQKINHKLVFKNIKKDSKPPSDNIYEWFQSRHISRKTVDELFITEGKEYFVESKKTKHCINFNYYLGKQLINIKSRSREKEFLLAKNAPLIFYNLNSIAMETECVCVEGEIDAMSYHEIGIKNVISVPNGATVRKADSDLKYMDNSFEYISHINKYYISTDDDEPGRALKEELCRRLGKSKCYIVKYPPDCKDANEVLMKHGVEALKECYESSEPYPITGIYSPMSKNKEILDIYNHGYVKGVKTLMMPQFDKHYSFFPGMLTVVTGVPSHGKALYVNTEIPTPDGYKLMKHLKKGDLVFDSQGKPTMVTNATEIMHDRPCYKLKINSEEVIADAEHQWVVRIGEQEPTILTTKQLFENKDKLLSIDKTKGIESDFYNTYFDKNFINDFEQYYDYYKMLLLRSKKGVRSKLLSLLINKLSEPFATQARLFKGVSENLYEFIKDLASGLGYVCSGLHDYLDGGKYFWIQVGDYIKIKGIEECESVPVKCIEVNSSTHQYLITKSFIPTHNSTFMANIQIALARSHNWKFGVFSPEDACTEITTHRYMEIYTGKGLLPDSFNRMTMKEFEDSIVFIETHFRYVLPDNAEYTIDNILESFKYLVYKHGINAVIIDPWNTIEHLYGSDNETTYISKVLNKIKHFGRIHNVHPIVVAHPRKMMKKPNTNEYEVPTPYDISGSNNWYNIADGILCIYRNFKDHTSTVHIEKVKHKFMGKVGKVDFNYNVNCQRYIEIPNQDDYEPPTSKDKKDDVPF